MGIVMINRVYNEATKEVVTIEEANQYPLAYKQCNSLVCCECGDPVKYKHGDVVIPYFAHDGNSDGHDYCPLYTPSRASNIITQIRTKFFKNTNIEMYYFIIIDENNVDYYLMLPALSSDEIYRCENNKISIVITYANGSTNELKINKDNFKADVPRHISLGDKPQNIFLRFYEAEIEKTKLSINCNDKTAMFVRENYENKIILRKTIDRLSIGQEYLFFSYKKYNEKELKLKKFNLVWKKDNYYLYSAKFEKLTISNYILATEHDSNLSLGNVLYDYSSDFKNIHRNVYKKEESTIVTTIETDFIPPIPIPLKLLKYVGYIIKNSTRGFGIINNIIPGDKFSIEVTFFKNTNLFPYESKPIKYLFDTTGKYYDLLPPIMKEEILSLKPIINSYDELIVGYSSVNDSYFKQWYKYERGFEEFRNLIAEIIINRKPVISNKSTITALAQMISGLIANGHYYKCDLSEKYEISLLELEDNSVTCFNSFFSTKRTLDDYLKLDNLNRNSVKLFTITKEGLENNIELIGERFIFFDYILEPLDDFDTALQVDVKWKDIKWYFSGYSAENKKLLNLHTTPINLLCLVAAIVCRPTMKKCFPKEAESLKWVNDSSGRIKQFINEYKIHFNR